MITNKMSKKFIQTLNIFSIFSNLLGFTVIIIYKLMKIFLFLQISGLRLSGHPGVDRELESARGRFRRLASPNCDVTGRMPDFSGRNLDRMSRQTDRSNSHYFAAGLSVSTTCQVSFFESKLFSIVKYLHQSYTKSP